MKLPLGTLHCRCLDLDADPPFDLMNLATDRAFLSPLAEIRRCSCRSRCFVRRRVERGAEEERDMGTEMTLGGEAGDTRGQDRSDVARQDIKN